jgi:hypothetical protein
MDLESAAGPSPGLEAGAYYDRTAGQSLPPLHPMGAASEEGGCTRIVGTCWWECENGDTYRCTFCELDSLSRSGSRTHSGSDGGGDVGGTVLDDHAANGDALAYVVPLDVYTWPQHEQAMRCEWVAGNWGPFACFHWDTTVLVPADPVPAGPGSRRSRSGGGTCSDAGPGGARGRSGGATADATTRSEGECDGEREVEEEARLIARSRVVRMASLRSGDQVLAMDERTGRVFVDRVSINLHIGADSFGRRVVRSANAPGARASVMSPDGNGNQEGVTIRHDRGEVSVTSDHVVLVDGAFIAAGEARVGQIVSVVVPSAGGGVAVKAKARILEITEWTAGVVSPLTHSGRILAGGLWQHHRHARTHMQQRYSAINRGISNSSSNDNGSGTTERSRVSVDAFAFTLVSTALSSPGNVQLLLIAMPSAMKLASVLFPAQVQRSFVVEQASLVVGCLTNRMYSAVAGFTPSPSPSPSPSLWAARPRSRLAGLTGTGGFEAIAYSAAVAAAGATTFVISLVLFAILDIGVGWPFVVYYSCSWLCEHFCGPYGVSMLLCKWQAF